MQAKIFHGRGTAIGGRDVEFSQFAIDQFLRPAVGDDMMHADPEKVQRAVKPDEQPAHQWSFREIKKLGALGLSQAQRFVFPLLPAFNRAKFNHLQIGLRERKDFLRRFTIDGREARAQGFVALDKLFDGAFQCRQRKRAFETDQ